MYEHLLSLLKEAPIVVIQDGQNLDTNKLVASVKYIWVLATPLSTELGVGQTRLTEDVQSLAATERQLCWIS